MSVGTRKLVVLILVASIFVLANVWLVVRWLEEKGVVDFARHIRHEYLTGTAIAVIVVLLILLARPSGEKAGLFRRCPVCDHTIGCLQKPDSPLPLIRECDSGRRNEGAAITGLAELRRRHTPDGRLDPPVRQAQGGVSLSNPARRPRVPASAASALAARATSGSHPRALRGGRSRAPPSPPGRAA